MTAPSLPETLARLAQLLPERVRGMGGYKWSTFYVSSSVFDTEAVWCAYDDQIETNPLRLHLMEFALREECDVRDWYVEQRRSPLTSPTYFARVMASEAYADTPAHALALALLGALGGEGV